MFYYSFTFKLPVEQHESGFTSLKYHTISDFLSHPIRRPVINYNTIWAHTGLGPQFYFIMPHFLNLCTICARRTVFETLNIMKDVGSNKAFKPCTTYTLNFILT